MSKSHGEKIQNYLVGGVAALAGVTAAFSLLTRSNGSDDQKETTEPEVSEEPSYSSTRVPDVQQATTSGPYDAILVMGGGRPKDARTPPVWVQRRLDAAAQVYNHYHGGEQQPNLLAVNGLSSHVVCPLNDKGLPVRHSGAAAQYLVRTRGIEPESIFMETTSYDTIGGAFFSRVQFSEIRGWRRLLVITCDWHVERVKEVFDWIFSAPHQSSQEPYNITFLGLKDTGLDTYVLQARREKETKSLSNVKELRQQYTSLIEIQDFLCLEHDMYAAKRLCSETWPNPPTGSISKDVKISYGMSPNNTPDSSRNPNSPGKLPSTRDAAGWSILPRASS